MRIKTTNEYRYFIESNFVGVTRLFAIVYATNGDNANRFNAERYYLPNVIIKNYNMITYRKNVYDQLIDSDIKRYEEMEKITRRQGEYFTTRCFLEYEYFKNHYRLIAVDLCRKKLLDADSNQFNK